MYNDKRILAIIPARGGSKGLPGKNIKILNGKPLIAWTIESARQCPYLDEIFVSTDSKEIANVCEQFNQKVPFLRPESLAQDTSTSADVVLHVLDELEKEGKFFDYFMLLEPTSPLRKKDDLKKAVELAVDNPEKDGVVSLGEVHTEHPMIVKKIVGNIIMPYIEDVKKITQRQQTDKAYFPYGVVYLVKVDTFKKKKIFYGENSLPYFIERWQNYEVDDIYDFLCIEALINQKEGIL